MLGFKKCCLSCWQVSLNEFWLGIRTEFSKFSFKMLILLHMFDVYVGGGDHVPRGKCRSGDNLLELFLSLQPYVGSGAWTRVSRLTQQAPLTRWTICWPLNTFWNDRKQNSAILFYEFMQSSSYPWELENQNMDQLLKLLKSLCILQFIYLVKI